MTITGETEITAEESYSFTGGISQLRLAYRIVSVALAGLIFVYVAAPAFIFSIPFLAGFFLRPQLWLQPFNFFGVFSVPAIALVFVAISTALLISAAVIGFVIAPIRSMLTVRARQLRASRATGLAGRATFELSDAEFFLRNETGLGERTMRFVWGAFDGVEEINGVIRLSRGGQTLAHIPLRAFAEQGEAARSFIFSNIAKAKKPDFRKRRYSLNSHSSSKRISPSASAPATPNK